MAAPSSSVLDDFNRASNVTPPPSANWSQGPTIFTAGAGLTVSGNACVREQVGVQTVGDDYWNPTTFGPDCECFVTVSAIPSVAAGNSIRLYLRLQQIGSGTSDGYNLIVSTNGTNLTTWSFRSLTDGVTTTMGANVIQIVSVGDSIGFQVTGTTLHAWYKPAAGSWTELDTRVDGSNLYPNAGYAGLGLLGPTLGVDDFGAGVLASGSAFNQSLTAISPGKTNQFNVYQPYTFPILRDQATPTSQVFAFAYSAPPIYSVITPGGTNQWYRMQAPTLVSEIPGRLRSSVITPLPTPPATPDTVRPDDETAVFLITHL